MEVTQEYKERLWAQYLIIKDKVNAFLDLVTELERDRAKYREAMTAIHDSLKDAVELYEQERGDIEKADDYRRRLSSYRYSIPKEDRRRVFKKWEIPWLCRDTHGACDVIVDILKNADCFGDIMGDMWGAKNANVHFASEEEVAAYKAEMARKKAEYEERMAWEKAINDNDYPVIIAYLNKHAEIKRFIHPKTNEEMFYYKHEMRLYTPDGRRFGYTKINEWNLVDEM